MDIDVVVFTSLAPVWHIQGHALHLYIMGDSKVPWLSPIPPIGCQGTQKAGTTTAMGGTNGRHYNGKGQQGDGRPDDGYGRHNDCDGRHNNGKGQQGDGRHDDAAQWRRQAARLRRRAEQ